MTRRFESNDDDDGFGSGFGTGTGFGSVSNMNDEQTKTKPKIKIKTSVTPEMVGRYLFARRWTLKNFDSNTAIFETQDRFGVIGVEVPTRPEARDYQRRLSEVLVNLSIIEHRPQTDIYYDILREAKPSIKAQAAYLGLGLVIFGFSLYSWLVFWGY